MRDEYTFLKGKPGAGLEELLEGAMPGYLGTVEDIQAAICALFPSARWEKAPIPDLPVWLGRSEAAEFQIVAGPDGQVIVLSMSRCERADVKRVAKELGLVALDEQTMERFGG
jgi:hypothetical protein